MRRIILGICAVFLVVFVAYAGEDFIDGYEYDNFWITDWSGMGAPSVSPSGSGRIYYDSTANLFQVSVNGGAYANLGAGGGATAWDDIADPDNDGLTTIDFDHVSENTVLTTIYDTAGTFFKIDNSDAALANEVVLLGLEFTDDAETNGIFTRCSDNNGDTVWQVGADGRMVIGPGAADYAMPTVRGAAGEVLMDNGGGAVSWQPPGIGAGDIITVAAAAVDTTADFVDDGDIDFTLTDGGAGGPDAIKADIKSDIIIPNNFAFSQDFGDINTDAGGALRYGGDSIDANHINTLNCGTSCTWDTTNDEIDVDDDFVKNDGDDITGAITFSGSGIPKKRVYISASAGLPPTTTGCADATQTELGTTDINRINVMTCDFDAATDEYWIAHFTLPENYDGGTFTAAISWTCTADAAKGVAWFVQLLGMTSGDVMGATDFGTAIEINDDGETTNDYLLTAESAAITENHAGGSGTTVGGQELWIKVYRDISDADDDLTTDGKFIGMWLTFGIDALSTED